MHKQARSLAKKIAKAAPLAVKAALKSSKMCRVHGQNEALKTVFNDLPQVMKSQDAQEGIRSFLERREAVFTGK